MTYAAGNSFNERRRGIYMWFVIDIDTTHTKVPREIMWWILKKIQVYSGYIDIRKDTFDEVTTIE